MFIVLSRACFTFKMYSTSFVAIWYVLCWFLGHSVLRCSSQGCKFCRWIAGCSSRALACQRQRGRNSSSVRLMPFLLDSWYRSFNTETLALLKLYMCVWIASTQQVLSFPGQNVQVLESKHATILSILHTKFKRFKRYISKCAHKQAHIHTWTHVQFDCSQEPQREGILGCRGIGLGRLQEGVGRAVFPFNYTSLQPQLYFLQVVSWFMTSCFPWFTGFQHVLFGHS